MVYRQVVLRAYLNILVEAISVRQEVEGLYNGAIGGVFNGNYGVVRLTLLYRAESICK